MQADNDFRLKELEDKAGGGAPAVAAAGAPAPPDRADTPAAAASARRRAIWPHPARWRRSHRRTPAAAAPAGKTPQEQYDYAFGLLKQPDYDGRRPRPSRPSSPSIRKDPLAGNAMYWLGRFPIAQGQYDQAAVTFLDAYRKYPKSAKAGESLLKVGLSMGNLGKKKEACAALPRFSDRIPRCRRQFEAPGGLGEAEAGVLSGTVTRLRRSATTNSPPLMAPLGPFEAGAACCRGLRGSRQHGSVPAGRAGRGAARRPGVALTVDHGCAPKPPRNATGRRMAGAPAAFTSFLGWTGDKPSTGLPAAAREARYALLRDWCGRKRHPASAAGPSSGRPSRDLVAAAWRAAAASTDCPPWRPLPPRPSASSAATAGRAAGPSGGHTARRRASPGSTIRRNAR